MTYYRQDVNGDRHVVSQEQHMIDSYDPDYMPVINAGSVTIYRMNKAQPTNQKPLKYGGKRRTLSGQWNGC